MNFGVLKTRTWVRLEDAAGVVYPEAGDVLNEGLRLFCGLTLCLERRRTLDLTPAQCFYSLLDIFTDWFVPLRVSVRTGLSLQDASVLAGRQFGYVEFADTTIPTPSAPGRVKPATLADLEAIDSGWQARPGTPSRYGLLGFDLLAVYKQPAALGSQLAFTYAAAPTTMTLDADTPDCPEEYHGELINYACYALRAKEGADEFMKGIPWFESFLDAAAKLGGYMRARSLAQRYDRQPFELTAADRSRLIKAKNDALLKQAREVAA